MAHHGCCAGKLQTSVERRRPSPHREGTGTQREAIIDVLCSVDATTTPLDGAPLAAARE